MAINVASTTNQKALLVITGIDGRTVQQQYVQLFAGNNNIAITLQQAAAGMYTVELRMADKRLSRCFLKY
jgi:hypothetical protein